MSKQRWARRCSAHRTNGEPCQAWAIAGGRVCIAHGGVTRRARQAADVRLIEASMTRQMALAEQRLREPHADWWTGRVMFAAEVLERDPAEVIAEFKHRGWLIDMVVGPHRWPLGLRSEDEPQLHFDRRFGRQLR